MIQRIRSLYNKIDGFLDRRAVTEIIQFTRTIPNAGQPVTAGQAFVNILAIALEFDRKAILKLIVAQQGVDRAGNSRHWEFFLDLPDRRAQLSAEWKLAWDEKADRHGPAQVTVTVSPFPPPDSPLRRMVQDGTLLRQQMIGMWKQEQARRPALSHRFRDSDAAMTEFVQQGLDPTVTEFSLHTGSSSGDHSQWVAETRDKSHFTSLE
jgi:hypothetical protein